MDYKNVILEKKDRIATLTLNRPQAKNALNAALANDIKLALQDINADSEVDVVIMTGTGNAFCAGMDLKAVSAPRGEVPDPSPPVMDVFDLLESTQQPIIAAVNGFAITGGFELALAADIIIACESAVFADTHAMVGGIPVGRNTQRLPRLVGPIKAKELLFTCKPISAREAERIGLVNQVVPDDKLQQTAREIAQRILEVDQFALRRIKQLINKGLSRDLETGILMEKLEFLTSESTRDHQATEQRRQMTMKRNKALLR